MYFVTLITALSVYSKEFWAITKFRYFPLKFLVGSFDFLFVSLFV